MRLIHCVHFGGFYRKFCIFNLVCLVTVFPGELLQSMVHELLFVTVWPTGPIILGTVERDKRNHCNLEDRPNEKGNAKVQAGKKDLLVLKQQIISGSEN